MADWEVDTAFRAQKYSLPESARDDLSRAHDNWIQEVDRKCQLSARQPSYSPQQRQCVLTAYRTKADAYRSRLRGDALAETKMSPETRAELQSRLTSKGFPAGPADGQFGPMTRDAIRAYQAHSGEPQTEFLSVAQRNRLTQQTPVLPQPKLDPGPTDADTIDRRTAESQCRSDDAEKRLLGCTAIITAPAIAAAPPISPRSGAPVTSGLASGQGGQPTQVGPTRQTTPKQAQERSTSELVAPTNTRAPNSEIAKLPYQIEGDKAVVEVTGLGATLSEARMDAIRLALQRTMQQLVVVDRLIKLDTSTISKNLKFGKIPTRWQ
jgi:peptidoglycan hydrolase-like protein with peptidoglycan-binding domain